ncbi:hypothetical protein NDU88_003251 [Pleurodeles waltl]|uniref:Uncharacterized protein n=1 Tax=Pleurodeles waltl TaxID=8319 RepID=A0AAV7MDC2_PLEWA|nr:hypothetical protein NDU88_003251 [Pleurodeles waltl]
MVVRPPLSAEVNCASLFGGRDMGVLGGGGVGWAVIPADRILAGSGGVGIFGGVFCSLYGGIPFAAAAGGILFTDATTVGSLYRHVHNDRLSDSCKCLPKILHAVSTVITKSQRR